MSQPIRGQGSPLAYSIVPKNTNFVEDVEIFLPVVSLNFREIEKVKSLNDGQWTTCKHNSALEPSAQVY